jgi:RNA polymerase sigma factor (sigma-70 family)
MGPDALRRYRAERLLRKDFASLRAKVLAVVRARLRGKGVRLDMADLEACYSHAWHGLYATVLAGETVESPSAWLVTVTFRRAIDESRAASRRAIVGVENLGSFPRSPDAAAESLAEELDDRARLREVFEGLRATLSERECEAAALCYLQGLTRAEAAERMGIGQARMGKLMEGAGSGRPGVAGKVGELLETIQSGGWCERQGSLMRAYAFGILDTEGERHALAVAHCRECPACRAHVASLRGLASVLPLPALSPAMLAGAGFAPGGRGVGLGARAATGRGSASGPVAAARRLAARGGRPRGGWSGLGGSLAPKLAAIALITVAGGYAVLGSRAHGSPPVSRAAGATAPPASGGALAQALFPTLTPRLARTGATRRSGPYKPRPPAHGSRSSHPRTPREFLPERVSQEQSTLASPSAPTRAPARTRRAGEFGIE